MNARLAALPLSIASGAQPPPPELAKEWQTLQGCTLIENAANDGDSFHFRQNGKEYIFRLFFVDAPETETRFPDRVKAQAEAFGISDADALKVGE